MIELDELILPFDEWGEVRFPIRCNDIEEIEYPSPSVSVS